MDELTGLPTHKDLAIAEPTAAIFLDIDGFIHVNDQFTHRVGDACLKRIGAWVAAIAESHDGQAYRVWGDEFLLLLPSRTIHDADSLAHTLVANCASLHIPDEPRVKLTVSAAVFTADSGLAARWGEAREELMDALYRAEVANGRTYSNVVVR